MAHLHHRHALPAPVEHLVAQLLEDLDRQRGRTGAEIEYATHLGTNLHRDCCSAV